LIDQDCGVSLERPRTSAETEKRLLAQLQDSGGRDVRVLWDLGVFYSQAGCHDQATACIQRVVELIEDPEKQAACFLALGQIEEQKRDYRSAATRYRSGIGLEPRDQRTAYFLRNNLGFCLNEMQEHEAAVPHLEQALEIDPARSNAYKNLALSHQGTGNRRRAAELFIAATRSNAADPRSLHHLESLVEANPYLLVDVPGLQQDIEGCRFAVEEVMRRVPGLRGH
jgi:tetratricopeptide (TPR) repeat protein